jgi:hypothetical protein
MILPCVWAFRCGPVSGANRALYSIVKRRDQAGVLPAFPPAFGPYSDEYSFTRWTGAAVAGGDIEILVHASYRDRPGRKRPFHQAEQRSGRAWVGSGAQLDCGARGNWRPHDILIVPRESPMIGQVRRSRLGPAAYLRTRTRSIVTSAPPTIISSRIGSRRSICA